MVIDTSALVAIHLKEPGWETLLNKAANAPVLAVGAPSLLEAAMVLSARTNQDARSLLSMSLRSLRIQVIPFNEDHFDAAIDAFLRYGKGRHRAALNFGDCMAYATATLSGLPLLYTGTDFAETDIPAA